MNTSDFASDDSSSVKSAYPATNWGMVSLAAYGSEEARIQALNMLVSAYYPVLSRFLKFQFKLSDSDVQDYLQQFILDKIIKKEIIKDASEQKGKFRHFLMKSISRFVIDKIRRKKAAKRSPNVSAVSLQTLEHSTADSFVDDQFNYFDKEFARLVVTKSLEHMKARCVSSRQQDLWTLFEEKVLGAAFEDRKSISNDHLVDLLKLEKKRQVFSLLVKSKEWFIESLYEVMGEYVDKDQIEGEIRSLRRILAND